MKKVENYQKTTKKKNTKKPKTSQQQCKHEHVNTESFWIVFLFFQNKAIENLNKI